MSFTCSQWIYKGVDVLGQIRQILFSVNARSSGIGQSRFSLNIETLSSIRSVS